MDSKCSISELEKKVEELLIEIDVALRPQSIILLTHFKKVTSLLMQIKDLRIDPYISKKMLHEIDYTREAIVTQIGYADQKRKGELLEAVKRFDKSINQFLSSDIPILNKEEQFFYTELRKITTFELEKCILLLKQISDYYLNKESIHMMIACKMFDIRIDFFCISQIVKNPSFDWDEVDIINEVHTSGYLEVSNKISEVLYKIQ